MSNTSTQISGAIRKRFHAVQYTLTHESCESCEKKNVSISYKLKLKYLCGSCFIDVAIRIRHGEFRPIHHASKCIKCHDNKVRQPYAFICNLCALEKSKCVRCVLPCSWFATDPLSVIMDLRMMAVLHSLSSKLRRIPLRTLFRLWKCFEMDKISLIDIKKEVLNELIICYRISTGCTLHLPMNINN